MVKTSWSRRDVLKSAGAGALGIGIGAAVLAKMDHYIVGTTSDDGVSAAGLVSDVAHELIDLSDHTSMRLVCGSFSRARRDALLSRDDVEFVQPDRTLTHVTDSSGAGGQPSAEGLTLPWGIDRVGARIAQEAGATGEGIDVGVIDSGIDDAHPDLEGNLADPDEDGNHKAWEACLGEDCNYPWSDDGDHGTHVAGTIAARDDGDGVVGVAPEVRLHALKVCSAAGACQTSAIVEAIRYAADQGWDVINLSLGSPEDSPALQAAGEYALEAGVIPIAAAGNMGSPDSVGYPAAYEEFVAVSATTIEDNIADFSSTGPEVDLAAPGADICSATVGSYDVLSGTSMAAPHVAGAAAQLIAEGYSDAEVRERLFATAADIGAEETEQGAGLLDVATALGFDSQEGGTGDGTSCPP